MNNKEKFEYLVNKISEAVKLVGMPELCDSVKTLQDIYEKDTSVNGSTSDGYHTFDELYHHRAILFSVIVSCFKDKAWKSKKHFDGTMYDGMFIVGINTPKGPATYHYYINPYWKMFDCKEIPNAPEWDGHTPTDAINRIASLRK